MSSSLTADVSSTFVLVDGGVALGDRTRPSAFASAVQWLHRCGGPFECGGAIAAEVLGVAVEMAAAVVGGGLWNGDFELLA